MHDRRDDDANGKEGAAHGSWSGGARCMLPPLRRRKTQNGSAAAALKIARNTPFIIVCRGGPSISCN